MGKKADAKKDSTAVAGTGSGGRDAVNININGNENKALAGQVMLNIVVAINLLVNLLLLHVIIIKVKHITESISHLEELEERQEQVVRSCKDNVYFKILLSLALLVGREVR